MTSSITFNVRIDSANLLSTFSTMVTTLLPPHSVPSEMIDGHHEICGIDILNIIEALPFPKRQCHSRAINFVSSISLLPKLPSLLQSSPKPPHYVGPFRSHLCFWRRSSDSIFHHIYAPPVDDQPPRIQWVLCDDLRLLLVHYRPSRQFSRQPFVHKIPCAGRNGRGCYTFILDFEISLNLLTETTFLTL